MCEKSYCMCEKSCLVEAITSFSLGSAGWGFALGAGMNLAAGTYVVQQSGVFQVGDQY